jgi:hypothetical protein
MHVRLDGTMGSKAREGFPRKTMPAIELDTGKQGEQIDDEEEYPVKLAL